MKRSSGFTLIELLVAVALLAAVAGTLLPMLSHYRQEAHRTGCVSQLGSVMNALHTYRQDHGRLPMARPMPKPIDGPTSLPGLPATIGPYHRRAVLLLRCPGDMLTLFPFCGSSYYYDTTVAMRPTQRSAAGRTPLLWDCDDVTLRVGGDRIAVPPFHGRRSVAYLDGHVDAGPARLPPPFGD